MERIFSNMNIIKIMFYKKIKMKDDIRSNALFDFVHQFERDIDAKFNTKLIIDHFQDLKSHRVLF